MNLVDRHEIQRGTATSIGSKIEEMLESAERKAHETGGAKKALQAHVKNLMGIIAAVDTEVEKSIPDLPTAQLIKTWLTKTVVATENLAGHLGNVEMQAIGEAAGYHATHDMIQKVVASIDAGVASLKQAVEEGRVKLNGDGEPEMVEGSGPRVPGVRPGLSIAQQRRSEETQEAKVKEEVSPQRVSNNKRRQKT